MKSNWIESGGGPLLFVARSLANKWLGTGPSTNGETDYQRACAVDDEIGTIALDDAEAVVLGDEPDRTTLISVSAGELLIVRWRWAESEEFLLRSVISEASNLPFIQSGHFSTVAGEHLLFDSACPGTEVGQSLMVSINATQFILETAAFEPSKDMFALVHRLRAVSQLSRTTSR
jgi:hypothetical protein